MSFEYEVFYIEEGNWRNHVSKPMSFCNLIWHSLHQHPDLQTIHVSHITIRHVSNVFGMEKRRTIYQINASRCEDTIINGCWNKLSQSVTGLLDPKAFSDHLYFPFQTLLTCLISIFLLDVITNVWAGMSSGWWSVVPGPDGSVGPLTSWSAMIIHHQNLTGISIMGCIWKAFFNQTL